MIGLIEAAPTLEEWNKIPLEERTRIIKEFFDECRELPAKQLQAYKDLITPDLIYVYDKLGISQDIVITPRNWLSADIDLVWDNVNIKITVAHESTWRAIWLDSEQSRRDYMEEYIKAEYQKALKA